MNQFFLKLTFLLHNQSDSKNSQHLFVQNRDTNLVFRFLFTLQTNEFAIQYSNTSRNLLIMRSFLRRLVLCSMAILPFFGPFLANVAIFESHFLEKKMNWL
jgi:hypothetical protein